MEKTLASIAPNRSQGTVLEQAQEIMWDAWDEQNATRRIDLARKALTISDDCADAYVLLAEEVASSLHEAMELYTKEDIYRRCRAFLGPPGNTSLYEGSGRVSRLFEGSRQAG